jgi:hypothetical protein
MSSSTRPDPAAPTRGALRSGDRRTGTPGHGLGRRERKASGSGPGLKNTVAAARLLGLAAAAVFAIGAFAPSATATPIAVHPGVAALARQSQGPLSAAIEADVRSAGLPLPPGLSVARREVRRTDAAAALDRLRGWWATADGSVHTAVRELLLDPSAASDERYLAWSGALAALGAQDFVDALAQGLAEEGRPLRRAAARRALHDLLGPWFERSDEVRPFVELAPEATRAYAPAVHAIQLQRRALAQASWKSQPAVALDSLDDEDPELVAVAARDLAAAVGNGSLNAFKVADALSAAVAAEHDVIAACALVDALTTCVRGTTPSAAWLADLRLRIAPRMAQAPGRSAQCWANLLAAMPAAADGSDDVERTRFAVDGVLALLQRSVSGPVDADVEIGLLQTLRSVVADLEPAVRQEFDLFAPTRDRLVLPGVPSSVRAAAAAAWGDVAEVGQLPALWNLLDRELPEAEVLFPLLGSLSRLAREGDWQASDRERLVSLCRRLIESGDVDLGRRAFELLETPGVVEAIDPAFLEGLRAVFAAQTSVDLRLSILDWIGRVGRPEDARALLAAPVFAEFLGQAGVRVARVGEALRPAFERWGEPSLRAELAALLVAAGARSTEAVEPLALRWTADSERTPDLARRRAAWCAKALADWRRRGRLDTTLAADLLDARTRDLPAVGDWTFDEARLAMELDLALERSLEDWSSAAARAAAAVTDRAQAEELGWMRIDHLRELGQIAAAIAELREACAWYAWLESRYAWTPQPSPWLRAAEAAARFEAVPDAAHLGLAALAHLSQRAPAAVELHTLGDTWVTLCEAATDPTAIRQARAALSALAARTSASEASAPEAPDPRLAAWLERIDALLSTEEAPTPSPDPAPPAPDAPDENP